MTIDPRSPLSNYDSTPYSPSQSQFASDIEPESGCRKKGKRAVSNFDPLENKTRRIANNSFNLHLQTTNDAQYLQTADNFDLDDFPGFSDDFSQIDLEKLDQELIEKLLGSIEEQTPNPSIEQEQQAPLFTFIADNEVCSPQFQGEEIQPANITIPSPDSYNERAMSQVVLYLQIASGELDPSFYRPVRELLLENPDDAQSILKDLFRIICKLPVPGMIYECERTFYELVLDDSSKALHFFSLVCSLPEDKKLNVPNLWAQAFLIHASVNPLKMIKFINQTLTTPPGMFPLGEAHVRNILFPCGNTIVYTCMANVNFSSVIKNWTPEDWDEICRLLLFIYPTWDFPFPMLECLAKKMPLEIKDYKNKTSLALRLYAHYIMKEVYARSSCFEETKIKKIYDYLIIESDTEIALMLCGWSLQEQEKNQTTLDQEKNQISIECFVKALKCCPDFVPALRGLAYSLFKQNNFEKALKILNALIQKKDRQALKIRADWFKKRKDYRRAIVDYTTFLNGDINTDASFARAMCYYNIKRYKMAELGFTAILKKDPNNWDAIFYRANCYLYSGMIKVAFKEWNRILKNVPKHINTLRMKAYTCIQVAKAPDAKGKFHDPKKITSLYKIASLHCSAILDPLIIKLRHKRKSNEVKLSEEEQALVEELLPLRMECYSHLDQEAALKDASLIIALVNPEHEAALQEWQKFAQNKRQKNFPENPPQYF